MFGGRYAPTSARPLNQCRRGPAARAAAASSPRGYVSTVAPKKLSDQAFTGQAGVNLIERRLLGMGYAWRAGNASMDAGIDGYVELRDPATGAALNLMLQVQSKATKGPWIAETDAAFEYVCEERDLAYWMGGNAPVVLVVSRPSTDEAYWVCVHRYFADPTRLKQRRVVFDKQRDRFDTSARDALMQLAVPRDAGFYTAPLPITEPLYSNLLRVTALPRTVYVAQTTVADRSEVRKQLLAAGVRDIEWVMRGSRLLTVHDPHGHGWRDVVDRGTVEDHGGDEWGLADDRLRRDDFNDFINLLGRCLSTRLRRLGVRYDDVERYYFFEATRDLTPRRIAYRSLKRGSKRVVFNQYATKRGDTVREWYRHSAFAGRFRRYDGQWFLEITPDYHFTSDGRQPLQFAESKRAGIKALERNGTVLGQVVMWADLLAPAAAPDLFADVDYPFLAFGELERFSVESGINEEAWLGSEDADEVRLAALSWDGLPLFPAEPSPYADWPTDTAPARPAALVNLADGGTGGSADPGGAAALDELSAALGGLASEIVADDLGRAAPASPPPTEHGHSTKRRTRPPAGEAGNSPAPPPTGQKPRRRRRG